MTTPLTVQTTLKLLVRLVFTSVGATAVTVQVFVPALTDCTADAVGTAPDISAPALTTPMATRVRIFMVIVVPTQLSGH